MLAYSQFQGMYRIHRCADAHIRHRRRVNWEPEMLQGERKSSSGVRLTWPREETVGGPFLSLGAGCCIWSDQTRSLPRFKTFFTASFNRVKVRPRCHLGPLWPTSVGLRMYGVSGWAGWGVGGGYGCYKSLYKYTSPEKELLNVTSYWRLARNQRQLQNFF